MSLFLFPNECATSYCSRHHWLTLCICCFKLLNNRSPCSLALHCLSYGVVLSPTKDLCTAARTAPSSSYATHIFFSSGMRSRIFVRVYIYYCTYAPRFHRFFFFFLISRSLKYCADGVPTSSTSWITTFANRVFISNTLEYRLGSDSLYFLWSGSRKKRRYCGCCC